MKQTRLRSPYNSGILPAIRASRTTARPRAWRLTDTPFGATYIVAPYSVHGKRASDVARRGPWCPCCRLVSEIELDFKRDGRREGARSVRAPGQWVTLACLASACGSVREREDRRGANRRPPRSLSSPFLSPVWTFISGFSLRLLALSLDLKSRGFPR